MERDQENSHYFISSSHCQTGGEGGGAHITVNTMIVALTYLYATTLLSDSSPEGILSSGAVLLEDEKGSHLKKEKQKYNLQVDTL